MRLSADRVAPGEALLAFGSVHVAGAGRPRRCSTFRSTAIWSRAANLFSHLRALDMAGASAIAVTPIPDEGLGEAINDRLARAAAGR